MHMISCRFEHTGAYLENISNAPRHVMASHLELRGGKNGARQGEGGKTCQVFCCQDLWLH